MESDEGGDEVDEGHEGFGEFVVASGNAPEFFDATKEPLHFLTHSIFRFVVGKEHFPVRFRRDNGFNALMFQESADVVVIIGFVRYGGVQPTRFWHSFPNGWEGGCVMALAGAQGKEDGGALIGAGGMQFGGQSASGFSYGLLGFAASFLQCAGGMFMRSNDGGINEKMAQGLVV